MKVDNAVYPKGEQLGEAIAKGSNGPIVMVNLLKFKDKAAYKDGRADDASGREAYDRYGAEMLPFVKAHGGRVIFVGPVKSLVIGNVEEMWDAVALVEYPSSEAFVKIAMSPDVAKFGVHREAGLAGQLLIQCTLAAP
ncbi:MAG: DUF1330 domain-containing protein [Alphaproteobacteria bacterium]|jgi:uncharacterized protein (DUF1330 family)|nr:DUF1330 domain-containing protein [Alphaproteobacteria bacterium]